MRRGFTLVEILMVIVVSAILTLGAFRALDALFVRALKSRYVTEFSLNAQATLDQLSALLYHRVPASVVAYDPADGSVAPLEAALTPRPVLEWLGTAEEAKTLRAYSGFVDMNRSSYAARTLFSPDTDGTAIGRIENLKFGRSADIYANDLVRLVFAGTFDEGALPAGAVADAFGWHGGRTDALFGVSIDASGTIALGGDPAFIYEKYYLADTAYAVARGADVDLHAACVGNLGGPVDENSLLLFFDYRPWKGESFCADPAGGGAGRVTLLAQEVTGFRAESVDGTLRLSVEFSKKVQNMPVRIAKQKAVF